MKQVHVRGEARFPGDITTHGLHDELSGRLPAKVAEPVDLLRLADHPPYFGQRDSIPGPSRLNNSTAFGSSTGA